MLTRQLHYHCANEAFNLAGKERLELSVIRLTGDRLYHLSFFPIILIKIHRGLITPPLDKILPRDPYQVSCFLNLRANKQVHWLLSLSNTYTHTMNFNKKWLIVEESNLSPRIKSPVLKPISQRSIIH